jgi:hypothetical protein
LEEAQTLEQKHRLNPMADNKNRIEERWGRTILVCGAKQTNKAGTCRQPAGLGTDHLGYGRCKFHAGASTGPKSEDGKRRASQNSRIHGLYAATLTEAGREIYDELAEQPQLGLEHEILLLKTQIITYLQENRDQNTRREMAADGTLNATEWVKPGTIEDPRYMRALNTLGRLVEKHARLNPDDAEDLLSQVNNELREASHGKIMMTWGGPPQYRVDPATTAK